MFDSVSSDYLSSSQYINQPMTYLPQEFGSYNNFYQFGIPSMYNLQSNEGLKPACNLNENYNSYYNQSGPYIENPHQVNNTAYNSNLNSMPYWLPTISDQKAIEQNYLNSLNLTPQDSNLKSTPVTSYTYKFQTTINSDSSSITSSPSPTSTLSTEEKQQDLRFAFNSDPFVKIPDEEKSSIGNNFQSKSIKY